MNFQKVMDANGENIDMLGTLKEFKGEGMTKNNKPFKKVVIVDDAGVKKNVKLYGTLPQLDNLNTRMSFSLSTYEYTYEGTSGKAYSGFWNDRAQVNQGSQSTSDATQKSPSVDNYNDTLCRIICAAIQSGQMKCESQDDAFMYADIITGGKKNAAGLTQGQQVEYDQAPGEDTTDYNEEMGF